MQRKKLQKLQKHLRTLKLFKLKKYPFRLPKIDDRTRFAIHNWTFQCGMPACVGGHAGYIFDWSNFSTWFGKFEDFFSLSKEETEWIIDTRSYKSKNPTPETAAKHIQDVLDGKIFTFRSEN